MTTETGRGDQRAARAARPEGRPQVRGAVRVWRDRRPRTPGDHAYVAYVVVVLAVVVAAPLARALWVAATRDPGAAALGSPAAPDVARTLVAAAWAGLLLLGRQRGPALRPLVVTWALASSPVSRARAFGRPVVAATVVVSLALAAAAGVVGWGAAARGTSTPLDAALLTASGLLAGVVAAQLWLLGQARPALAGGLAAGVVVAEALALAVPALRGAAPWGWVGLSWPGGDASPWPVAALLALAVALVGTAPAALARLDLDGLLVQAARWESVTAHAGSMELSSAAALLQARPRLGRRLSAVPPARSLLVVFVVRSAVGAARTPARLAAAVVGLLAGGVAVAVAVAAPSATASTLAGALAALVVFTALGPLTDGVRHALHVVVDHPLYGIGDARLVGLHLVFPAGVLVLALAAGAGLATATGLAGAGSAGAGSGGAGSAAADGALAGGPADLLVALAASVGIGLSCLAARLSIALKGPLPPELLTPVPTPIGDLSVVVQLAWALDGLLLSLLAGATMLQAASSPWAGLATAVLVGVGLRRWRRRGA